MIDDTIEDVVARIRRYGDRCRVAGDFYGESLAIEQARMASLAATVDEALRYEQRLLSRPSYAPVKKVGFFRRLFSRRQDETIAESTDYLASSVEPIAESTPMLFGGGTSGGGGATTDLPAEANDNS